MTFSLRLPARGRDLRRALSALASVAVVVAGTAVAPGRVEAARPVASMPSSATGPASASRLALATGERVEVTSERTEYAQMFAEPTGRFTYESAVTPQRVHRADGSWDDIDLTLESSGGVLRPRASAADVRFSAGGTGPLVTLVKGGGTLTVSWPLGALPVPALDGDSATYANILPGVDLVVRATRDGFSHVLTVRTTAAAVDPRLKEITFDLGGTARVRRAADGSLTALAGGGMVASAGVPTMWDSTVTSAVAGKSRAAADGGATGDSSTPAGPADTATTAPVGTALTPGGDLILKPDAGMLASATLPLFIDPLWSTGKSRWAYSTNNNSNNSDTSRARVGKDPSSSVVYRSYFEFPITAIRKKFVYDAYVQMKVDHTWSCTNTPNTIFSTNPISGTPRTAWKSTSWYLRMLAQVSSHANEGTGCDDSPQPDVTINFNTDAVKSVVQAGATAGSSSLTFVISAVDSSVSGESTQDRWKKYYPDNAKLITDVDAIPGKPTEQYVNKVRCGTATIGIGTTAPVFSARMPDADTTQSIKATWEWQRLNGSSWVTMTAPAVSSAPANTPATSATVSGGVNGVTYRFHVKGTDPAPYNQSSAYSDWCQFKIDTADPPVSGVVVSQPAGPGRAGQFKIRSEATDVAKFRYGWNAAVTEIAPAGTETVDGVTYKYVVVTLTAPKYGLNTLFLQAVDTTGNVGDGSITFTVDRASPPVARWGLETYPGVTTADSLADQQSSLGGDTPLAVAGGTVTWTDKGRLIGGTQPTFNGSSDLTTGGPVVDTTKSYGVAAWVRVDDTGALRTIASQDGDHVAGFELQYRNDDLNGDGTADKSFCLVLRTEDVDDAHIFVAACGVNTAVAGRWTHVAGSVDATEKKIRIWVDGVLKQEVAVSTLWPASHQLRIGSRKYTSTANAQYLVGAVADVQVFDRALVQEDLTGDDTDPADAVEGERGMLNPVEVARWDFDDAVECWDPAIEDTCEEPDSTAFNRRLQFTPGVMIADGPQGRFGEFDDRFPEDNTTVTREYGLSQKDTGSGSSSLWQDAAVLFTDQSFTVTARVHLDSVTTTMTVLAPKGTKLSPFYLGTRSSTVDSVTAQRFEIMFPSKDADVGETYTHVVASEALAVDDAGTWHNLTAVYDAGAKQFRLYVNGVLKNSGTQNTGWNATGPIVVGGSWYTPDNGTSNYTDRWYGGIDDIHIFLGAMTDAQVAALNAATES